MQTEACKQKWDKIVHKMRKYALKVYVNVQVANCKLWKTTIELLRSQYSGLKMQLQHERQNWHYSFSVVIDVLLA